MNSLTSAIVLITFWGTVAQAESFDCTFLFNAVSDRTDFSVVIDTQANEYQSEFLKFQNYIQNYKPLNSSSNEGRTEQQIWTAHYFPKLLGGIATRWQRSLFNPNRYLYPLLSLNKKEVLERLKNMKPRQINTLSAVEKLDIALARYGFPATRDEMLVRGPLRTSINYDFTGFVRDPRSSFYPFNEFWRGYCNGVCAAGVSVAEPQNSISIVNRDGVRVIFEIADIKALYASYYLTQDNGTILSDEFTPLEMNIFIDKWLIEKGRPFFADISESESVWNKTIVGAKRTYIQIDEKTLKGIVELEYADGGWTSSSSNRVVGAEISQGSMTKTKTYLFQYKLDENGSVKSSEWISPRLKTIWYGFGNRSEDSFINNPHIDKATLDRILNASQN